MNVFQLDEAMIREYAAFSRSFTKIKAQDIFEQIDAVYKTRKYWPEPIVQINPHYKRGKTVAELVTAGVLHPSTGVVFADWKLRTHQAQAVHLARDGKSFVVTTGTGSGKSVCFFLPIVDAVLRARETDTRKRTRAIIVYPMNALANSQIGELDGYFRDVGARHKVTYKRFTGQEDREERIRIRDNPPDILLTNYMMLELLLTRQDDIDQQVIANCEGLEFLVLDELHTYRGRQGADVAMLVRRVKQRMSPDKDVLCIGTSATMTSEGGEGGREVVAKVASKLFAKAISHNEVVIETLERQTDPMQSAETVKGRLAAAIRAGVPEDIDNAKLKTNPLAIWAETTLGLEQEADNGPWKRATPRRISGEMGAAELLSKDSGLDVETCTDALKKLLLVASRTEVDRTGRGADEPFFGVRLHQFISGAGRAHTTIEPEGVRRVVLDGQKFLPEGEGDKLLFALHFCHNCGQEHLPVWLCDDGGSKRLEARSIDDLPFEEKEDAPRRFGFFMPVPSGGIDFTGIPEDYPETWTKVSKGGDVSLDSTHAKLRHQKLYVRANGDVAAGGVEGWFQPGKFRICPACGEETQSKGADLFRLASLSAEGRSSATTVLVSSILKTMHAPDSGVRDDLTRKVLGFTDNRQDAALQAGHFNDATFVSLLRAAILRALDAAGPAGLVEGRIGAEIQKALGFVVANPASYEDWLSQPNLEGARLGEAEQTLREVLGHRFWVDQQRGWRVTNPNLERLHLMRVQYDGLDALVANEAKFKGAHPTLRSASPATRRKAFILLLDHMRKGLAVDAIGLEKTTLEDVKGRSASYLKSPWALGEEKPRESARLMIDKPARQIPAQEEIYRIRGGATSALGRALRDSEVWGHRLTPKEYVDVARGMLSAAEGLLVRKQPMFFKETIDNWMLYVSAIRFVAGDGVADEGEREANPYFLDLYRALAVAIGGDGRAVLGFEAREHTAQVDSKIRQVREARFRQRKKDKEYLASPVAQKAMSESPDTARFLPVMFCSPTMELGVDIAELDLVYMRNVPPTAANYAQRSGRAGRGGQAALIVTYCSAQGPHDQYYFNRPSEVVKGVVKAPTIDLTNQDMVESHLQAMWLAETRKPLSSKIADVLNLDAVRRPIVAEIADALRADGVAENAIDRVTAVLRDVYAMHADDMTWVGDLDAYCARIVARAPIQFDKTFDRWRALFDAAERQVEEANARLKSHTIERNERRQLEAIRFNAERQMELLRGGSDDKQADFYTYRYLATEGFLPGYNFPRLPLVAFVSSGRGQTSSRAMIQRPRFVGISEFGPNSLVYHEGRQHRVRRLILKGGDQNPETAKLATQTFHVCENCGAAHKAPKPDLCMSCRAPLADAMPIRDAYRIEQVETVPADRITANEEERQRRGFEIRTVYEWPVRDGGRRDIREATVDDNDGPVARLVFGPATTIRRFNVGLRRRDPGNGDGFDINPRTGYWSKAADEDPNDPPDPEKVTPQRIIPYVEDRKNALLFTPAESLDEVAMADLQYALLRGLELVYQLEEGEILGEALPERSNRKSILIYEAAEGGAGVLSQIVAEPNALAEVARSAIETCHFDKSKFAADGVLVDVAEPKCVAGCYRCLLSYFNQPDHATINRRDQAFKDVLARLARSGVTRTSAPPPADDAPPPETPRDPLLAAIVARGLQPPDEKPMTVAEQAFPYVWRSERVVATPKGLPIKVARQFTDKGLFLLQFDPVNPASPETLDALAEALGATE